MKVKTKKNNRLLLVIVLAIILVIGAATAIAFAFVHKSEQNPTAEPESNNLNNVDYSPPTNEQKEAARDTNSKTDDPTTPPQGAQLPVTFTALNQYDSQLQARVLIGEVIGSGACTLTMEKDGETTIRNTADLQALPSSSTCKGFNVPTSNIAKGTWKVRVTVESNGRTGSVEKEVDIK